MAVKKKVAKRPARKSVKKSVKRPVAKKAVKRVVKKTVAKKAPVKKVAAAVPTVSAAMKKAVSDVVKARTEAHKIYDQARQGMAKIVDKEVSYLEKEIAKVDRALKAQTKKAAAALAKSKKAKPGTPAKDAAIAARAEILSSKASVAADLGHLKDALKEAKAAQKANQLYMKGVEKLNKDILKKMEANPKRRRKVKPKA